MINLAKKKTGIITQKNINSSDYAINIAVGE
jgi:hypothetical protein